VETAGIASDHSRPQRRYPDAVPARH